MKPREFIEKAVEGGWDTSPRFRELKIKMSDVRLTTAREMTAWQEIANDYIHTFALLDPSSWQAVGKVEGWGEKEVDEYGSAYDSARYRFHVFADHLFDGKPLETALVEATSN